MQFVRNWNRKQEVYKTKKKQQSEKGKKENEKRYKPWN